MRTAAAPHPGRSRPLTARDAPPGPPGSPSHRAAVTVGADSRAGHRPASPRAVKKYPAPARTSHFPAEGESADRLGSEVGAPREEEAEGDRQRRAGARYLTVCHSHVRVLLSRPHLQLQGFLTEAGELQPRRQLLPGQEQLHAAQQRLLRVRRRSGHDPAAHLRRQRLPPVPPASGKRLRRRASRSRSFTGRTPPRLTRLPRHPHRNPASKSSPAAARVPARGARRLPPGSDTSRCGVGSRCCRCGAGALRRPRRCPAGKDAGTRCGETVTS